MIDQSTKPRILIIGDAVANTGFAKVIFEIFSPMKDKYELVQLGTNYFGDPHNWPWKIFPAGIDAYKLGEHRIRKLVEGFRPSLIFMLQDPWALIAYMQELTAFPAIPTIVYASFNSEEIDPAVLPPLSRARRLIVYTQFAKHAIDDLLKKDPSLNLPEIEVIPHGVNTAVFRPLDDKKNTSQEIARKKLYPADNEALQNGFIVLNANRNQPRKRIDLTMEGFSLFAKYKPPNIFLHLHMGLKDLGWDLHYLARKFQLEDRLIYSTTLSEHPNLQENSLNTIFNAADVGINTASSEGWGLLSFEQAAAGLPQIVPDHSSGRELWKDCAYLLPYEITLTNPHSMIAEHIIHPEAIASALQDAWNDREELINRRQLCYANATKKEYAWPLISSQWEQLFDREMQRIAAQE
ncbi:MAG: glycosyltransferase [Chitinophagaceae bacterium]